MRRGARILEAACWSRGEDARTAEPNRNAIAPLGLDKKTNGSLCYDRA